MKRFLVTVVVTGIVVVGAASVAASASAGEVGDGDGVQVTSDETGSVRITNREW
ncbi:hypothetical protein [Actinomadura spongiicola]|uniref:hypothetical protein n=1 Tax=Actinomadura spongiicola TaxID=2303421 RepID=UPI001314B04A|nr:hypothetical protein [Actinomadura spongiicola]